MPLALSSNDADMTENLMAAECTTILDALLAESGRKLPGVAGVICAGMDEDGVFTREVAVERIRRIISLARFECVGKGLKLGDIDSCG